MDKLYFTIDNPSYDLLNDYAKISISFVVSSIYNIELKENGLGGVGFIEKQVEPYTKHYDSVDDNPLTLMNKFNIENWKIVSAFEGNKLIGGAIIAYRTAGIHMLEDRSDLAVLWDIRVDDDYRGCGIGHKLLEHCIGWAKENDCTRLKIETQNINTKACKFYARQGAKLTNINKYKYKDNPDEIELIWSIDIETS